LPPPGTIVAHAPCRVDLAGGTLDLWPLYLFHPGAVTVNFAVNILTRCKITRLTDDKIRFKSLDTKVEEEFRNFGELCAARKFKHPLAGHLARFFAPDGGFEIETHSESPAGAGISGSSALMIATTAALARYTGKKLDREQIRIIAQNVEAQLIKVPTGCQDYYPAFREEWKLRKTNSPRISTPMIEKLIAVALRQGALAAKVCGAGGGGCVVFLTEPENREHISAAIRSYGGHVLPAMVARDGLTVSGRSLGAE
jgi:galactokinase/mevalonate kinase-like predicted kinase